MSLLNITYSPHESNSYRKVAAESKVIYSEPFGIFNPSACVLPEKYKNEMDRILDLEVREDDVWVISYPKCGTTWTQEMTWLLMNDLDYEKASKNDIMQRSPFIEFSTFTCPLENSPDWIDVLNQTLSPRCVKTHLQKELMPRQLWTKKPKIIYVARNPKDVLVSFFHHHKSWMAYTGSFETLAEAFLEDSLLYGPYWKHIIDFWNIKEPNVLFNTYEEMKKDLKSVIRKTAKFLNKNLTDEQVNTLEEHLSFKKMKENPSVNYDNILKPIHKEYNIDNHFMRKGESGAWKEEMTPELSARIDAWSAQKLGNSDFPFYRQN